MSSTWCDIPVNDAKNIAQSFINNPIHGITGYSDYLVDYDEQTEVLLSYQDIIDFQYDRNYIYAGIIYLANKSNTIFEGQLQLNVSDSVNFWPTFDASAYYQGSSKRFVIWNDISLFPNTQVFFMGYKFTLVDNPNIPNVRILTEDGDFLMTENGFNLIT